MKLSDHWDDIREALYRAAEAIEDIDDPRHYTKEDLAEIKRKANLWRKLAGAKSI